LESGGAIDHAENPEPRGYTVEISQLALQARENRKRRETRQALRLVERDIETDFAPRARKRAVGVLGSVTRNVDVIAVNPHPGKRQRDAGREDQRLRKREAECLQFS